jgi:hypothetical protein
MTRFWATRVLALCAVIAVTISVASADSGSDGRLAANLSGFHEVTSILSNGSATFRADVTSTSLTYTLTFSGLTSPAVQSHLHFAQSGVNGGVFLFLCGSAASPGPAGTPTCPANGGTVTRTVTGAAILALPANNLTAGDFQGALRIIRNGDAYANIHTTMFPAGEIRGQVHSDF